MSQLINDNGEMVPVTLVQAGPCVVTQIRTADKDGYQAIQIGFGEQKKLNKSQAGHLKPAKSRAKTLREIRIKAEEGAELKAGDKLDVSVFEAGDTVKITGINRGKGFAGTIKRHNFSRGPKTHGSRSYRRPGSIGSMYPQKVWRGKKMAGRLGAKTTTTSNLTVAEIMAEDNLVAIKGAVPGPSRGTVLIRG